MTDAAVHPDPRHPLLARLPVAAQAVRLRALHTTDIDEFLAYRSDPEVARYQGWGPMDRRAALSFLQDPAPLPWQEGDWAQIGIARADDNRLVGDIGLLREGPDQVQLGFSLARAAQGRGWAQAAVGACIAGLLQPLGITRLRGITDARNAPSLRLLARLGFVQTGCEDVVFRGEACTEITLERRT
jgi:aminoglycoside 6'-N-acetyltransferase